MAQARNRAGRARQVGRALAVQVGQHRDRRAIGHGVALEAEPGGDAVDGQRAVERRRQRQEAAGRVGEAGDQAGRVDRPLAHRGVGGAGRAEADHRLAGP
jgi:hypothetical protein